MSTTDMTIGKKAVTLQWVGRKSATFALSYVSCILIDPENTHAGFRLTITAGGVTHAVRNVDKEEVENLYATLEWDLPSEWDS